MATVEDKTPKAKPSSSSTSVFVAEHDVTWHGISLLPVQASFVGCIPSQLPACASCLAAGAAEWENENPEAVQADS